MPLAKGRTYSLCTALHNGQAPVGAMCISHQKLLCSMTRSGGPPKVSLKVFSAVGMRVKKLPLTPVWADSSRAAPPNRCASITGVAADKAGALLACNKALPFLTTGHPTVERAQLGRLSYPLALHGSN